MKFINLKGIVLQTSWITPPVLKQCFVTFGVSLNMAALGLILGFTVVLEQLKLPDSSILVDDEEVSWIASIFGIFAFPGTILVIPIMGKYGRRTANLASIVILIVSWVGIVFAPGITILLIARAVQGINIGMTTTLGSFLISEYTSPRNRGAFLVSTSVLIASGIMFAHLSTYFMTWRICALLYATVALIDLVIVLLSPESPSWLASQGRYEECKKEFRWLRGETEEEELYKMIEACRFMRNSIEEMEVSESVGIRVQKKLSYFKATVRKPEFYKPLLIVGHLYTLILWSGINVLVGYPEEYLRRLSDYKENVPLIITSIDLHRAVASVLAMYIIKKIRRRIMLLSTVVMNVIALIAIAIYSYTREHYSLPFDHPMIGVIFSHILMFPISVGSLPLPFVIAGEIFPLRDKPLAGGIGILIYSFQLFFTYKTTPYCLTEFGLVGFFCIYAVILSYCMTVVWFLLPETMDRTLQDIEEDFRRNK